jgi:hypothetical protein
MTASVAATRRPGRGAMTASVAAARRQGRGALTSVAVTAVLAGAMAMAGCVHAPHGDSAVSEDVVEALRSAGRANVVVALALPAGFEADAGSDRMRDEIARLQDDVLGSVDPADFQLGQRFAAVPALTGTVLTERGLRALAAHPSVVRVDLDAGGGGADPVPPGAESVPGAELVPPGAEPVPPAEDPVPAEEEHP